MHEALALLNELSDADLEWLFGCGIEQQVITQELVITEGSEPEALYIVLEGLLGVRIVSLGDQVLATLGAGEIIGEISFLEGQPASASIVALENTLLLSLPRRALASKLQTDRDFAARLYRSFALIASRRLKERVGSLGSMLSDRLGAGEPTATERGQRVAVSLERLKELLLQADREALRNDGVVPEATADRIVLDFTAFCELLNSSIGDDSPAHPHAKQELGARVQRELLPYILLSESGERFYSKPRGYAGDFLSIARMYENQPRGTSRLGAIIDRCFLNTAAVVAARNRRPLLGAEIRRAIAEKRGAPAKVTTLACGPAAEVFDVFEEIDDPSLLEATLIDIDLQALAFVGERRDKLKLKRQMNLVQGNLVYLATGRQKLELSPQDLVYSVGLIDYFDDRFVINLLDYVYELLAPGGRVILGNFHPRNPTKALQDHVLDWPLIHRTEDDMHRLFRASAFAGPCASICLEPQQVNLFAEGIKE